MPFKNDILAGEELIRSAARSANYVAATSGWRIARTGDAEFNNATLIGSLYVLGSNGQYIRLYVLAGESRIDFHPQNVPGATFIPGFIKADLGSVDEPALVIDSGYDDQATTNARSRLTLNGANDVNDYSQTFLESDNVFIGNISDFIEVNDGLGASTSGFFYASGNLVAEKTTNTTIGASPSGDVTVVSQSVTTIAGRSYKISADFHGISPGAASADRVTYKLVRGSTVIRGVRVVTDATNVVQCGGHIEKIDTPGAGTFTYHFKVEHETGAGSASMSASTANPVELKIEGWS